MTQISIQKTSSDGVTIVPNVFIQNYMPEANGEFVKVYLYLLRILSDASASFTLADGADALNCTERDILRALKYWDKAGVLDLSFDSSRKLSGIRLLSLQGSEEQISAASQPVLQTEQEELAISAAKPAASAIQEPSASDVHAASQEPLSKSGTPSREVSREVLKKLQDDEDFAQLLFIAEQYLGRTLSSTDTGKIAYFYDQLKLPCELIEYLIEYCVSGGHRSIRYIERVALSWAEKGIFTVDQAKEESTLYNKNYFSILKALGVKNRNPVDAEISIMDTWLNEYGFTLDIIKEACTRTVLQTGQPSFQYADRILEDWKKNNVRHLEDIAPLDTKHNRKKTAAKTNTQNNQGSRNRFNNFHQRDYDYESLEKQLLTR